MQIESPPGHWFVIAFPFELASSRLLGENHMARKSHVLMVQSHPRAKPKPKFFIDTQVSMLHRRRHRRSTNEWFRTPESPVSGGRWNCARAIISGVGPCTCMHTCICIYICICLCVWPCLKKPNAVQYACLGGMICGCDSGYIRGYDSRIGFADFDLMSPHILHV